MNRLFPGLGKKISNKPITVVSGLPRSGTSMMMKMLAEGGLTVVTDERRGADSQTQLYYIPVDQIGSGTTFTAIKLPLRFFPDAREDIEVALRPS